MCRDGAKVGSAERPEHLPASALQAENLGSGFTATPLLGKACKGKAQKRVRKSSPGD